MNPLIRAISFISFFFFFFSCQEKEHAKIEIYTLRDGTIDTKSFYDSIRQELIYAPKFEVRQSMLMENPLIMDGEILGVDTTGGNIIFTATGFNKIINLKPSMKHGIKFAICENKKPLMTGYFWSSLSSYGSTWNCIEYNHLAKTDKSPKRLKIYRGNGIDITKREKINFKDYPELLKALAKTNRIIK